MPPTSSSRLLVVSLACLAFLALCLLPAAAARLMPGAQEFNGGAGSVSTRTTAKKTALKKMNPHGNPSVEADIMNLLDFDQPVNLSLMVQANDGSAQPTLKKTTLEYWFWCVLQGGSQQLLGSGSTPFDKYGNASVDTNVLPTLAGQYCARFLATYGFSGRGKLPRDSEILARLNAQPVGDDCTPGTNTHCLNEGRFQVEVNWDGPGPAGGEAGFGQSLGDDSGLFFFFGPDNWEMLVKVLDGCSNNNHYWVFAAAATDVEFELTVTDTATNQSTRYSNPLGNPAPAIMDTQAFATCP